MHQKSFPDELLSWNSPLTLPSDRLVLTKIVSINTHMPDRLVFSRSSPEGVILGAGGQLSDAWSVFGWLDTDVEIELFDVASMSAEASTLVWTPCSDGSEIAEDGFGGHYIIDRSRKRTRLRHQIDVDRIISIPEKTNPHTAAQTHHNTRLRRNLKNAPDQ
jgi:hypothetical protein